MTTQHFDGIAGNYDAWYDRPEGRAVFGAELKCIRSLCGCSQGSWLEVGVGTGRFASSLHIRTGVDPSLPMLRIAKGRGVAACAGLGEDLPFPDASFDGILLALSLCFMPHPLRVLRECRRILRPGGNILIGIVPAGSSWGRAYIRKKEAGHPVYASANFFQVSEILSLLEKTGLTLSKAAGTLFWSPEQPAEADPRVEEGIRPDAGFLALLCIKAAGQDTGNFDDRKD
ncbi:MAG: class I SAM-dependent methyltransferase [Acidobacteria bacterium]|nr:class I SAM-dependent methyltransferase [Acidobacteriota bacterium]